MTYVSDKYAKAESVCATREDTISFILKGAYCMGFAFTSIFGIGVYLYRCDMHALSPLMDICVDGSYHSNFYLVPLLSLVQFLAACIYLLPLVTYMDIMLSIIVFGTYTMNELM